VSHGTPDMEIVPTDEKSVRRAIRIVIGDALGGYYGDPLRETIPSRFSDLLRRLDEPDKAYSEKEE
jgi:hypothetical protein